MIIDDLVKNLKVLGNTLIDEGYDILMASSGAQALKMTENIIPDLILLDIMMPAMSGFEVCSRLKSSPRTSDIPVIFLTAKDEPATIVEAFRIGGVDYIVKPVQTDETLARINTQLELKYSKEMIIQKNVQLEEAYSELKKSKSLLEEYLSIINSDMENAAGYVVSLLPENITGDEIETNWKFVPSAKLGGDSLGFHWIDGENLAIYIIDVCGHGIGPALHSVSTLNALRFETLPETDFRNPSEVVEKLNNAFLMFDHNDMYFTMWYGVYNKTKKEFNVCGAGHPPLIIINEDQLQFVKSKNTMVGAIKDHKYDSELIKLKENTDIFVYSDGVYEIDKHDGKKMTHEELAEILLQNQTTGLDGIFDLIKIICSDNKFNDDFTIIKLTVK